MTQFSVEIMTKGIFQTLVTYGLATTLALPLFADVKLKTKRESGGRAAEDTIYFKGPRARREINDVQGEKIVTILQCDKNRVVELNPASKKYVIVALDLDERPAASSGKDRNGGEVTLKLSASDTGDHREMFGYTARRVKSTINFDGSSHACAKDLKFEEDGWYADLSPGLSCHARLDLYDAISTGEGLYSGCHDTFRFKTGGFDNTGYPLKQTTIIKRGKQRFTSSVEVTELSNATLDASLFEIPEHYVQARDNNDFMLLPKNAAVTRIGVPLIKNNTSQKIDQMRETFIASLRNAGLEPVALDGDNAAAFEADARRKQCDYVLSTEIASVKKKKHGGGVLGAMVGEDTKTSVTYDVVLAYKVNKLGESKSILDSTEESREGVSVPQGVNTALEQVVRKTLTYLRQNE
jgi:hypothetical protein